MISGYCTEVRNWIELRQEQKVALSVALGSAISLRLKAMKQMQKVKTGTTGEDSIDALRIYHRAFR
jgi:hypothetical protein